MFNFSPVPSRRCRFGLNILNIILGQCAWHNTHLVEPTVVDAATDDGTGRREQTHDAHVQANIDRQHEQAAGAAG